MGHVGGLDCVRDSGTEKHVACFGILIVYKMDEIQ